MSDPAAQLELVKAKAKEVILRQQKELEAANQAVAQARSELAQVQARSADVERALEAEKDALKAANDALTMARGQGGVSLTELAKIGNERESEREAHRVLADTLSAAQKQLQEAKKELASAQYARQEAERAAREDVEAVRARLEAGFGQEKARLTRELEEACAELNAARQDAVRAGSQDSERLQRELASARAQQDAAEVQLAALKQAAQAQVSAAQNERDEARARAEELQRAGQEALDKERAQAAAGVQKLKDTVRTQFLAVQRERDEARASAAGLAAELQAAQAGAAGGAADLQRQVQELHARLDSQGREHAAQMEAVMERVKAQFQALSKEKDDAAARAQALEQQLAEGRQEGQHLAEEQLALAQAQHDAELQRIKEGVKAQFQALSRERDALGAAEAELSRANAELARQVEAQSSELAALRQRSALAGGGLDAAERRRLEAALQEELERAARMQQELERAEEAIARLAEDRASNNLSANTQVAARESRLHDAERVIEELRQELGAVKADSEEKRMQTRQFVDRMRREVQEREQALTQELNENKQALSAALGEIASSQARLQTVAQQAAAPAASAPASEPAGAKATASAATAATAGNPRAMQALEEAKTKAEVLMREAAEEANKAKRDHAAAKREALALAKSLDKIKNALGRAHLQASGTLALAADRCEDALRSCDNTVEAALAVAEAAKTDPSKTASGTRPPTRRRTSASSPGSSINEDRELNDEEKLMQVLIRTEQRLDDLAQASRQLLPKIKDVCALAVQEKQVASSTCDMKKIWALLKGPEKKGGYSGVGRDENTAPKYSSARIEPEFGDEDGDAER